MFLLGVNSVAVGLYGGGLCSVGRAPGAGEISSQIKELGRILRGLHRVGVGFGSKYLYRPQPADVCLPDCKSTYAGSIPASAPLFEPS